jgi:hypothetical protein
MITAIVKKVNDALTLRNADTYNAVRQSRAAASAV